MEELSPRQREILELIRTEVSRKGVVPSFREIGAALGIRSTNAVSDHVKALQRKGYLERVGDPGRPRSLRLTLQAADEAEEETTVPVPVLGRVAAGVGLLAEERFEGSIRVDSNLLPSGGRVFALKVQGESMIEAGILPGDLLFVREQPVARDGEIVVALVDNEATVKRLYRQAGGVRLQPANAAMAPILVDPARQEFQIVGVAVGLYRSFR
jgi:repressor LexA